MRSGKGGGRKGGGGPILISAVQRTGGSTATQEASAGDAYYNNPNVSRVYCLLPRCADSAGVVNELSSSSRRASLYRSVSVAPRLMCRSFSLLGFSY